MAAWVIAVDAAPEDGDRASAAGQSAAVRLAVHASGQTAHDDNPGGGQLQCELTSHLGAVGRAAARSDDGNRGIEQSGCGAAHVEPLGRIVKLPQEMRIARITAPERRQLHAASSAGER